MLLDFFCNQWVELNFVITLNGWIFHCLKFSNQHLDSFLEKNALAKGKVFSKQVEIVVHHVNKVRLEKSGLKLFEHNL